MNRKYVNAIAAVMCAVGVIATGTLVSNAQNPDVKEYTDSQGNKVIEYLNPVDPGNEPAADPADHPSDLGQVQGDLMTVETPVVETTQENVPVTLPLDEDTTQVTTVPTCEYTQVQTVEEEGVEKNNVQYIESDVITYTDAYGNKVTEFLNPVDPGNEPATMPDYVPSTEGNIQGDIMTLDEPIIMP